MFGLSSGRIYLDEVPLDHVQVLLMDSAMSYQQATLLASKGMSHSDLKGESE